VDIISYGFIYHTEIHRHLFTPRFLGGNVMGGAATVLAMVKVDVFIPPIGKYWWGFVLSLC